MNSPKLGHIVFNHYKTHSTWNLVFTSFPFYEPLTGFFLQFQFSTPIGSGSLTLLKAFVMACVIYVPGAAFASSTSTVNALFSYVWIQKIWPKN